MAVSEEKGAATSVYLATSPEVEGVTVKYSQNCKPKDSSKTYPATARPTRPGLWQVSERLLQINATVPPRESARHRCLQFLKRHRVV